MESTPTPNPSPKPSKDKDTNIYLQYSGMAFEMLITIGVFAVVGHFLDKKLAIEVPVATIVLTMTGLGVAFYRILKKQTDS